MNDNWYKVTIYKNPFSRTENDIVFVADSRKIYEITLKNGKKDLVRILSKDLYINVKTIFDKKHPFNGHYKITHKGFCEMVAHNRIKETKYKEEK